MIGWLIAAWVLVDAFRDRKRRRRWNEAQRRLRVLRAQARMFEPYRRRPDPYAQQAHLVAALRYAPKYESLQRLLAQAARERDATQG